MNKISFNGLEPKISEKSVVLPGSFIIGNVNVADNVIILFNTVLRADMDEISIGEYSNVQDNTTIHTDKGIPCLIGKYVTIGHNCVIHGSIIHDNVIIGMNSTLLNKSEIPSNIIVAANSLVPQGKKLESGWVYGGNPVQKLKPMNEKLENYIKYAYQVYQDLLTGYRSISF